GYQTLTRASRSGYSELMSARKRPRKVHATETSSASPRYEGDNGPVPTKMLSHLRRLANQDTGDGTHLFAGPEPGKPAKSDRLISATQGSRATPAATAARLRGYRYCRITGSVNADSRYPDTSPPRPPAPRAAGGCCSRARAGPWRWRSTSISSTCAL